MNKVAYIIIGIALLAVGYIYYSTSKRLSNSGEVVESMQVCDPKEVTKMPETFN